MRLSVVLLAVCLAALAGLPALARGPASVANSASADSSLPPSILPPAQTVPAPQRQTSPRVRGQPARFENISTADGLSFPFVRDIVQDQHGFVWFATLGGLNKYDGYRFTVYTHDPGDPTTIRFDEAEVIYEDSDGTLWVGGGGGLDRFDRATGTFTHVDTRGQVFCIHEDSAGTLWVGFWHGLYGYDRATGTIEYSYQQDPNAPDDLRMLSGISVYAIYEDQRGDLWIGTGGGLGRLNRETEAFVHYQHDPDDPTSLSGNVVTAIFEDRQGTLWIGTAGGLNKLDRSLATSPLEQEQFIRFQHDPDDPYSLSDDDVTSILEDSTGILWVGTGNGLNRLAPSTSSGQVPSAGSGQAPSTSSTLLSRSGQDGGEDRFLHYWHDPDDPHSLSDDAVFALYEDRSGVLWIATVNGVSKYIRRTSQFTVYRESGHLPPDASQPLDVADLQGTAQAPGLSDNKVLEICEDRAGVFWIGTLRGGLNSLDRGSGDLTVYRHDPADPDSLSDDTVTAIYEDRAGVLWVGTGNGWLERFDPRTETFVHHRHLGETSVSVIAEDPLGNLWLGTGMEGLYRLNVEREVLVHYPHFWRDPDHWKKHGTLSSHIVETIHVDQTGVPWIGTYFGGINLWDSPSDRFSHYRRDPKDPNSLSHRHVLSFCEDPSHYPGVMWIGTMGGGLNRLDRASQTFTHYVREDGLADDIVGCILADDAGFLWLSTPKGLSRFDPRTETFRNYDERDGVLSGGVVPQWAPEVCLRSKTGEMWFGGSDGLYVFDPARIEENSHVPPIAITALKIHNQTVWKDMPADEHIRLPHDENFVSFEFAALDHTIPEKNQYAYIMEGLDKDWVHVGTRRYADYPDLKPGDYVFRVKGSNNDGVWNEEGASVRITIEPPIWGTWAFRVSVALALVLGAVGVYRQRVRRVEARSRELQTLVEERTVELQQEIEQRSQVEEALRRREREQAVVAERNRLARELHDSATQSLYAVTLYADAAARLLSSGQRELASDNLHKLRRTAKEALAEMRLLIFELRPPILEDQGLVAALQVRLEAVEGRSGLRTEFHVEGEGRLPPDIEEGLYRIAREALNNALKHAQAHSITISLHLEPEAAVLEVTDDGMGFDLDLAQDSGGMGLRSMAERAEAVGARFEIESEVGRGTKVVVVWATDEGRKTDD